MLKQKIFKNTKSSNVSATIDEYGDLYFHNIPSQYLLPFEGVYQVKEKDIIGIWEYEFISGNHNTKNWKNSKCDRQRNYGLNFFTKIIRFDVINQLSHFDLDGTKSTTALGEIVLFNEEEGYELNLTVDILLPDSKLDEHSLEFGLIEADITKKHRLVPNFVVSNLAENVTTDLGNSDSIIGKYLRARIFDSL